MTACGLEREGGFVRLCRYRHGVFLRNKTTKHFIFNIDINRGSSESQRSIPAQTTASTYAIRAEAPVIATRAFASAGKIFRSSKKNQAGSRPHVTFNSAAVGRLLHSSKRRRGCPAGIVY